MNWMEEAAKSLVWVISAALATWFHSWAYVLGLAAVTVVLMGVALVKGDGR